ncbi:malonyl-ACP O-methyltransferase BioC [Parasedimentitalea maritima]|uniref:Malonyl-[acyl-carrier protein] O-methyltransferase n=1 Tax=Parasedimentitalea maritima TaxID=2578117 RepID=A0A6A4RHY5_9RHOB|nr:malonyl-ACP O-methyltransferase BioC [Zongyanglinia marina]KAE9629943.1 malonyl-ACP O-methyltransferase BioC [Zongyanglinia marina]
MTSSLNQNRVRQSFRRGLSSYHMGATAQAKIATNLVQMLREQGAPVRFENVLEFGCGTGHLTRPLIENFDIHHLSLNDLVAEALSGLSVLTSDRAERTDFTFGPIETVPLPKELDLIASASTVQWVSDVPALMARLVARLCPGGWLAVSGFGRAQFHELRNLGSDAAAPSYHDAQDWPALLPRDVELMHVAQEPMVLQFDSVVELLRHLRKTGVNAQASQRWNRGRLREFEAAYRHQFGQDGKLPLTYDPVCMIARKCR